MRLVVGLDYVGDLGRVNHADRVILALSLLDTPAKKSIDGPVPDVDATRLITGLEHRGQPMANVVTAHNGQWRESHALGKLREFADGVAVDEEGLVGPPRGSKVQEKASD